MKKPVFLILCAFAATACAQFDAPPERQQDPRDSASVGTSMRGGTDLGVEAEREEAELRKKQREANAGG